NARETCKQRRLSETSEPASNLVLKDHDDCKNEIGQKIRQYPCDRFKLCPSSEIEEANDQAEPQHHLNGARSLDEDENLVDEKRNDEDIEYCVPGQERR